MERKAIISECGKYRYQLTRIWDDSLPKVMFIMLNPSTADANQDDPTIRRCINFAKSWGYGGILVGNLFAFRATNPKELLDALDPIGPENKKHIDDLSLKSEMIICAWGNSYNTVKKLILPFMYYTPLKGLKNLHYLSLCGDGTPKHPLYLKGDLKPIEYKIFNRNEH